MLRSLLIFVILSAAVTAKWDHFEFDVTVFCHFSDRDVYNMVIYWDEVDRWSRDEHITQTQSLQPRMGKFSFSQNGAMNGDQILSSGYQPKAVISHDCTSDRKEVDLEVVLTTLCTPGDTCHYRFIKDLTNQWGVIKTAADDFKVDMSPFPDFP
ncbi:unnamed protein product [Caenorhabditis sp. 36 PRJEB53466]|nr:unnamed protein product [Caenorhabditis sp. 36 PRJEB53466]